MTATTPESNAASAPEPLEKRRRFRWKRRVAFYLVAFPALLYGGLSLYLALTRLPDLGEDLSVLLPADGVLFYAEMASPARVFAAARDSPMLRAMASEDDEGNVVDPTPFPGEDERSLRHAAEDAAKFRRAAFIFSLFKSPMTCALARHPDDPRPAVLLLTRSEPDAIKSIMSAMLSFAMTTTTEERRGVTITTFADPEEPGDSFQHAQLGDVFAVCYGTANPAIMRGLADAWFRPRPEESFAPKAKRARQLVESFEGGEAERRLEWAFATGDGRAMFEFALDETDKWLNRGEENDAAFWLGIAEMTKRAGWFAAQCRSAGGGASSRLELRCVANHARPIWSDGALEPTTARPPKLEEALDGMKGDFVLEATRADSAAMLLAMLLPSALRGAENEIKAMGERADALRKMPRPDLDSPPFAMRVEGRRRAEGGGLDFRGWLAQASSGVDGMSAFDRELELGGDDADGRFANAKDDDASVRAFAWPGSPSAALAAGASELADALVAEAAPTRWMSRFRLNGTALDSDDWWRLGLDLTERAAEPGDRREPVHYLQFLRGVDATFASAAADDGSTWSLFRLAPRPGAFNAAAPSIDTKP